MHHRRLLLLLLVVQKCHCNNPAQTYFALLRPIRCIYHCYIVQWQQWTSFHFWFGHGLLFDTPLMNLTILVISSAPKTVAEIKHGKNKAFMFSKWLHSIFYLRLTASIYQRSKYLQHYKLESFNLPYWFVQLNLSLFTKTERVCSADFEFVY